MELEVLAGCAGGNAVLREEGGPVGGQAARCSLGRGRGCCCSRRLRNIEQGHTFPWDGVRTEGPRITMGVS